RNAPIIFADELRYISGWKYEKTHLSVEMANLVKNEHHIYQLDLIGYYQTRNLVTVLETVAQLQLKNWKITQSHVEKALKQVKKINGLHGRWEVIHQHPKIVLDVGHNAEGIRQIAAQIELTDYRELHIIIGMVKDKEIQNVLPLLPKEATYYFTRATIPRAIPEHELQQQGAALHLSGDHYPDVNTALENARKNASKEDLILICGSVYVVGEVKF
ncbi:MAG: glutamate ligase domain-containing protein, partial [Flavitalea sp.]